MTSFHGSYSIFYFRSYGDLVPKTKFARVIAMMWMMVGMVTLSLFSGKLTAALTVAQVRETNLYGEEVYLLNYYPT